MKNHIINILVIFILGFAQIVSSQTMWNYRLGFDYNDYALSAIETVDNHYLILGEANFGNPNIWLLKFTNSGDTVWTKVYGERGLYMKPYQLKQIEDENFIICGEIWDSDGYDMDGFLLMVNSAGDTNWLKEYDTTLDNPIYSVEIISSDEYLLGGSLGLLGNADTMATDVWLIKTDNKGDTIWTNTYQMFKDYHDWELSGWFSVEGTIVYQLDGGGYIIGGTTRYPCGTYYNAWLIRTDVSGNIQWSKYYGGDHTWLSDYLVTNDGGFILAVDRGLLIKTDSTGDTIWTIDYERRYSDGDNFSYYRGLSLFQAENNFYLFGGYHSSSESDVQEGWLAKIDSSGKILWEKTYKGNYSMGFSSVSETSDGGYLLVGSAQISDYDRDLLVVKTDSLGNTTELSSISESVESPNNYDLNQNYPNPFNPSTKIKFTLPKADMVKIEVYNTLGQRVESLLNKHMRAGNHEIEFNSGNLSSGVYFYRIEAGEFQDVKKMILLR